MSDRKNWVPEDGPKTPLPIFKQDKKSSDRAPDFRGEAILTDTIIAQVVALRNAGLTPVLGYAAWSKDTRNGSKYLSGQLQVDTYQIGRRHGKSQDDIEALINSAPPATPQAAAPSDDFLDSGDDLFDGTAEPEDDDPFA